MKYGISNYNLQLTSIMLNFLDLKFKSQDEQIENGYKNLSF